MRRIDTTYKLYYGGAQKRPDGQYSRPVITTEGKVVGQVSEASRKDVRNAVEAAQKVSTGLVTMIVLSLVIRIIMIMIRMMLMMKVMMSVIVVVIKFVMFVLKVADGDDTDGCHGFDGGEDDDNGCSDDDDRDFSGSSHTSSYHTRHNRVSAGTGQPLCHYTMTG